MRSLFAVLAILMFVASIGCNGATETPPAGGDKTEEKKEESASVTPATGDFQEVSLTLPTVS